MRVKICGITRVEDAIAAEAAGADAIGLVFAAGSPRRVTREQALELCSAVGPLLVRVGVFRDAPLVEVLELAAELRLGAVQLHGDVDPQSLAAVRGRVPVIRAVAFRPELERPQLESLEVDGVLLDGLRPGSGLAFDWQAARPLRGLPRLTLAGGLTPENVAAGIGALQPYAVDVSSGVESRPGIKDAQLMRAFVAAARREAPAGVGR